MSSEIETQPDSTSYRSLYDFLNRVLFVCLFSQNEKEKNSK